MAQPNALEQWISSAHQDEVEIMNYLQENGMISDNCVWAADVGNCDEAIEWLEQAMVVGRTK